MLSKGTQCIMFSESARCRRNYFRWELKFHIYKAKINNFRCQFEWFLKFSRKSSNRCVEVPNSKETRRLFLMDTSPNQYWAPVLIRNGILGSSCLAVCTSVHRKTNACSVLRLWFLRLFCLKQKGCEFAVLSAITLMRSVHRLSLDAARAKCACEPDPGAKRFRHLRRFSGAKHQHQAR